MTTKEAYLEYLKSDHWKKLRQEVMRRDGFRCVDCGRKNHLQAHHTFYHAELTEHVAADFVTVCFRCHQKRHGLGFRPAPKKFGPKRQARLRAALKPSSFMRALNCTSVALGSCGSF